MGERAASRVLYIISGLQVFITWMQWARAHFISLSCLWRTYDAQREGEGDGEGQGADLKSKQTTEAGNEVQGKLKNLTALSINETCSSCLICTIIPKDTVRLFSKFHRVA